MKPKDVLVKAWAAWDAFWFADRSLYGVSLFRCVLACVLFVAYLVRGLEFDLFFSAQGLLLTEQSIGMLPAYMKPTFVLASDNTSLLGALYIGHLILLFGMVLGVLGRKLRWLVFVGHLLFMQRNTGILYGVDFITTFWLFYLSFINCNSYWSVKNILFKKSAQTIQSSLVDTVFIRLVQVQLCVMYAYTGMEKLKGTTWWDGSAVWYVMADENMLPWDLGFMQHLPWLIAMMTFTTLLFEIYFPFAMLQPVTRRVWLFIGFSLHGMAAVFMGLYFFSGVMLASYLVFVPPEVLKSALQSVVQRFQKRPLPAG